MDKEELIPKFTEALGGTQLQLSEQTMDGFYEEVLAEVGTDDAKVTDEFLGRKVNYLKTLNGQLHADVSKQVDEYKKMNPHEKQDPPKSKPIKSVESDEVVALKKQVDDMQAAQKSRDFETAKNAIKESVKNNFEANQKKAGLKVNPYFLKQTIRDLKLPDEIEKADLGLLTKQLETDYSKAMKEADFDQKGSPLFGKNAGGGKGKSAVDSYFESKKLKEGWGVQKK